MRPRHPTVWLMTDERADPLAAARRLPRGGGIVFRHYATPTRERRALWRRLRALARARGLLLLRAGATPLPGEDGTHGRRGALTWPAHDRAEARAGRRAGAKLLFVSPIYATRSHPDAATIGPRKARRIGHGLGLSLIALGGMNARRYARLSGFAGWAAIDAFS